MTYHERQEEGHGLSPRVRGNQTADAYRASYGRFIPACAGEPYKNVLVYCDHTVYPRVCGGT